MTNRSIRLALSLAVLGGALLLPPAKASAEDGVRRGGRGERASSFEPSVQGGASVYYAPSGFGSRSDARVFGPGTAVRTHGGPDGRGFERGARYAERAWRGRDRLAEGTDRRGSFIEYHDGRRRGGGDRRGYGFDWSGYDGTGFQGSRTLTTFGDGDWRGGGSVISYGAPPPAGPSLEDLGLAIETGPKIIDVASERLDRRPIGPSGIDVIQTGGAKIIRIAPGYRMADAGRSAPRGPATRGRDLGLQPWSSGWLDWCTRTYRSFDAELGTYVARGGTVRFCQPD